MRYDIVYTLFSLQEKAKEGWRFTAFLGKDREGELMFLIERAA